jgi:ribosomal 50S subunit-recycling heat shock protein
VAIGMLSSRTEADRLVKSGAVEINGARCNDLVYRATDGALTVRVGKKWKRVIVKA